MKRHSVLSVVLVLCIARPSSAGANPPAMDTSYWEVQTTGVPGTWFAISAVDRNTCWLAGISGKILRTTDEGYTWSVIPPGIIGARTIYAFEGASDSIAFASTTTLDLGTYLFRTTNAGSSWDTVFSQPPGFIFGIKMFDRNDGIAAGDPVGGHWTIARTTNGGESWYRIASEPPQIGATGGGTAFGTFDTSYVWFSDSEGRMYISSNRGETWTYSSTPASGSWFLAMNDPDLWLVVSSEFVYRWTRGGGWVVAGHTPGFPAIPGGLVGARGTTDFWLSSGVVFYTPDAGSTWTSAAPHGLEKRAGLIDMVTIGSEVSAWATGIGDTVYHYHRIVTDVAQTPRTAPRGFSLSQNFPNPFNPATTIGYQILQVGLVRLVVYDVLGREVATLVNGVQTAGGHTVEWNAEGVSSGFYICRLDAKGRTVTRKMLLLR